MLSHGVTMRNDPRAALLLDEVHAALLRRDYEALPALSEALAKELDHPSEKLDMQGLQTIRHRAERNAGTLTAIQRGIRAAVRRINDIRSASAGMVTYDRSGRKQEEQTGQGLAARF